MKTKKRRCSVPECPSLAKHQARRKVAPGEWVELHLYACNAHRDRLSELAVDAVKKTKKPPRGIQIVSV